MGCLAFFFSYLIVNIVFSQLLTSRHAQRNLHLAPAAADRRKIGGQQGKNLNGVSGTFFSYLIVNKVFSQPLTSRHAQRNLHLAPAAAER